MTGHALVTGGSRGIGKAIALSLAADAWDVTLTWRTGEKEAGEVVREILERGGSARALRYAQGTLEAAEELHRQATASAGPVHALVNNAAMAERRFFEQIEPEHLEKMLAVNFHGPFFLCREVLPGMAKAGRGRVVNIASIAGRTGGTIQPHYAAAKAALLNLTRSLARAYAGRGVNVNAVSPGAIETRMLTSTLAADLDELAGTIPAGRAGTPEEVAAAVRFLCSEDALYITGQVLDVNGGIAGG